MTKPACVIVAFHRPVALAGLLEELRDQSVVVVNVEADTDVAAVADRAGAPVVTLPGNPGYAAAVNAGARALSGGNDVVVFMNDDVSVSGPVVDALAAAISVGQADVVIPALLDGDGVPERTIAALPTPKSLAIEWALLPDRPVSRLRRFARVQKWRSPTGPEPIDAAAATVVAVWADLLAAEPLPESYFLYWEESEWFWRLRQRQARVLYRPDLVAGHTGGRADVRPEKSRLLARNAVRCVRRTQGRGAALAAVPIVIAWNLRLLAVALIRRHRVGARWAGVVAACGSWSAAL